MNNMNTIAVLAGPDWIWAIVVPIGIIIFGLFALILMFYRKVEKGTALVVTGLPKTKVIFNGGIVIPLFNRAELMDISVKRIELDRTGKNGLICKDNMRADIKVAFFVRVNNIEDDVLRVAESIGCDRASSVSRKSAHSSMPSSPRHSRPSVKNSISSNSTKNVIPSVMKC